MFYAVKVKIESEPNDKGKTTKSTKTIIIEEEYDCPEGATNQVREMFAGFTGGTYEIKNVATTDISEVVLKEDTLRDMLGLKAK